MNRETPDILLDNSQLAFCQSTAENIRLLAPAGCGKTASLLYRCRELVQRADRKPRFLIVTFTKTAAAEIRERLEHDTYFESVKGNANVTTLNSWGWNRIRNSTRRSNPKLLDTANDLFFAMKNQLRPVWDGNQYIEPVVNRSGSGARTLMNVMDNLKSLGFVHTRDVNLRLFQEHLESLQRQGLTWRVEEQFEMLTDLEVLDRPSRGDAEGPSTSVRGFYERFFTFWRKATSRLLEESTFTFEDQKYWNYLDISSNLLSEQPQARPTGPTRYDHVMVDEFQDINPLDMALIKSLAEWHRATLTVIGDDDQAIFEWRGATPEYILHPDQYLGRSFTDFHLKVNYRSPQNIVDLSQCLISNNIHRAAKEVQAVDLQSSAEIEIQYTDSIQDRLAFVTKMVESTQYPGKVAVISRLRRQLIPYQIYFVSEGAPFNTTVDLDIFSSAAFDNLIDLLEAWENSNNNRRMTQVVDDTMKICDLIRRRPLGRKNRDDLGRYLRSVNARTTSATVDALKSYDGPRLNGKTPEQLHSIAKNFLQAVDVSKALQEVSEHFDGLQFDRERAEEDVFFTAPPLEQLAEIARNEQFSAYDLIERIEAVKARVREYRDFESDITAESGSDFEVTTDLLRRPLHLMTATRAKGKEFDTVVLLDTVEGIWPYQRAHDEREIEAERRLFYVAFTRARRRVVLLANRDTGSISRFVEELGLPHHLT